jgi:hypothetical protein
MISIDAATGKVVHRNEGGGRVSNLDDLTIGTSMKFGKFEAIQMQVPRIQTSSSSSSSSSSSLPEVKLSLGTISASRSANKASSFRVCLKNVQILSASRFSDDEMNVFTIAAPASVQRLLWDLDDKMVTDSKLGDVAQMFACPSVVASRDPCARSVAARFVVDGGVPREFAKCVETGNLADVHMKLIGGVMTKTYLSLLWTVEEVVVLAVDSDSSGGEDDDEAKSVEVDESDEEQQQQQQLQLVQQEQPKKQDVRLELRNLLDNGSEDMLGELYDLLISKKGS